MDELKVLLGIWIVFASTLIVISLIVISSLLREILEIL